MIKFLGGEKRKGSPKKTQAPKPMTQSEFVAALNEIHRTSKGKLELERRIHELKLQGLKEAISEKHEAAVVSGLKAKGKLDSADDSIRAIFSALKGAKINLKDKY